jgi:K+-transporting ATPase KdpF subunit
MTSISGVAAALHSLAALGTRTVPSLIHQIAGAFIAHMSGADFFGLVVSVLVIAYLFYALIRGEKL